jgi:hypothetical protein
VESQGLIELADHRCGQLPDAVSEATYVDGSHLFGLGFGRAHQAGAAWFKQRLKGQNARHVRGHWHYGDDAAAKTGGSPIRTVIADDHDWPPLIGL